MATRCKPGGRLPRLHLREGVDSLASPSESSISTHVKSASEENLDASCRERASTRRSRGGSSATRRSSHLSRSGCCVWFAIVGSANPFLAVLVVVVAALGGWSLPTAYLKRRARSRGERIDLDMPELIDMLVATVEAGVAFSSSLQMASKRLRGPLGEEVRLTLQEQSMGLGLNDALNNMLERQNTASVRAFVRSLVQGEQLGVSIGQTLRNLSTEMRTLRRQLAEERAQKAPVKLVFPVVLLILPALFIVTLGPAFLRIEAIFK